MTRKARLWLYGSSVVLTLMAMTFVWVGKLAVLEKFRDVLSFLMVITLDAMLGVIDGLYWLYRWSL